MKKTIINKWALAALATALTACTADEPATNDQEAKMDPNTPVGITATLGAYGNSAESRATASRADGALLSAEDLAAIEAKGQEITESTEFSTKDDNRLYLYNYAGTDAWTTPSGTKYFKIKGSIKNGMTFIDKDGAERTEPFYLKDFNVNQANKAAVLQIYGNPDIVTAATDRTVTNGAPVYAFTLKHMGAKVSVRLQDKDDNIITPASLGTDGMKIVYPGISTTMAEFDNITQASDFTYKLANDGTITKPLTAISDHEGYYNALIGASAGTGTGEDAGTVPTAYTADSKLTVALAADATAGKPAGTYSLPLSSVKLTGLAAGDSRATDANGNGTWTYTRPGEHIFVTLTVDQNQVLSATATIGKWDEATASAEAGKPGTDAAKTYPSIEQNGTGDNGQPIYEIRDASGLQIFADIVNGVNLGSTVQMTKDGSFTMPTAKNMAVNGVLTADIDLGSICHAADESNGIAEASWTPIGGNYTEYTTFSGSFDGQGHTVKNLYINSASKFQGLFGITDASIKDLTVEDAYVNTANNIIGAIIGKMEGGTLTGCTVTGSTTVSSTADGKVGGIIGTTGFGESIRVENCHVTEGVTVSSSKGYDVGGIIGNLQYGTMTNCSSAATVTGKRSTGGLVGEYYGNGSIITGCVCTGNVSGTSDVGGLIGYINTRDNTLTACYATGTVSGTGESIGGLVGKNQNKVNILGCYYSGTLGISDGYIGAFVGYSNDSELMLTNCAAFSSVVGNQGNGIGSYHVDSSASAPTVTNCQIGIEAGKYSTIYTIVDATKQADGSSYWKSATDATDATTGSLKLYWEE